MRTTVDSEQQHAILLAVTRVGGVTMLELLVRLEYKRQALRRKVLGMFRQHGESYFALAGVLVLIGIMTAPLWLPAAPIALGFGTYFLAALIILGILSIATVILAPASLIFF